MKQKRIFSLALAAALALSLTACQSGGGESSSQDSPAAGVAVQVQEVTVDTISTENKVSGRVVTDGQESVFVAAQTQCTALFVEVGDSVTAGQTLCTLDMASTLSSYSAASISYNSAVQSYQDQAAIFDKQIALAEKNVSDLQALFEIGAASQLEVDQAELSLQSAQAQRTATLAQLEAGMQSYKSNVEQLSAVLENVDSQGNVIAPISGTIIALNAAEGSYVTPSAPVAVIDGVDQLEVSVSVSEALVPKLAEGDEVDVSISALGKQLVGSIKKIENTASMQTKLYNVTISILEDVEGLMSGMFADVSFRTDTSADTIVIPTEAILTSNGAQYVFVVDGIVEGRGTARYAAIGTGLTGSGVTEVTSGLGAGDMLVTVGQAYLSDGDAVRIVTGED
ncbi:MAG: efflux RND transporter periplasmic adaptor subunit [Lawsonibacter sp.]|jgi:RND family efflux transporter MFP subunit|uniref:efflux RND transporter periplasmic adaptor subunit n=1 Tax=Lawsonibacter sp. JLR.KK007 TaxID=3114293 RepID=UPI00216E39CB|nr:efflux RND transporter periplasmic adaptor subunit [Lawsonibacter sp.]MCI8990375.1 efflux RND transporter periplasmic adaptor subunit [Lawsonibacter sp.]MCI9268667.1 efflux RND transporter periplasmic adaptor subunit [Lawsonibacter sp.]